jgi:2-dehydro-3-deoxyphosphogluconate aldolase / (4S)-4-hydroxy-2-oxoglutarate aldolase
MATFSRLEVALQMQQNGIIPVFYHPDHHTCYEVIKACFLGGLRVFEFTNRGEYAHEVFEKVNKRLKEEIPELILGAGSIIDTGTASLYIQLGANFIVSPVLKEDMAITCNRRKILWSPGCATLSEISRAEELGAEIVKIFPGAQVGGPDFVKAIKGPMPWTSIMPTGGVEPTKESLSAWFSAGVTCVGMGSNLITKEIITNKAYTQLTETVKAAIQILHEIRNPKPLNS